MKEIEPTKSETAKREEEILKFWQENNIFKKSESKPAPAGEFVFYEGPPTANGRPGIHHLEARAFKDAIPRYKTMCGFEVRRRGGWDTHGLPVELEVEKKLGLKSKKEIESYGIGKFNEECKKSVWSYVDEWRNFTERIGYWVDLDNPYVTYKPEYMESVWHIIGEVDKQGLLYQDYRVVPWCTRCGTALSSHELAQGYAEVKDLSVYVKFELEEEPNTFVLAWTTTPWTLPGNVALAVGEDIEYVKIKTENGFLILAKKLSDRVEGEVVEEFLGKDLVGKSYKPLWGFLVDKMSAQEKEKAFKIYPADFVTTEDGTGVVHTAVMYGQDDFELGTKIGLPKYHIVNEDGTFKPEAGFLAGKFVKDEATDVEIIKELAGRDLLFKKEKYTHTYPFCWRCKTPLIYFARDSWYIRMSALKDKLVKENEDINWEPAHIKDGRFGEWLLGIKDWAISRERYWGTPLPIWRSADKKEMLVIGSIEELKSHLAPGSSLPTNIEGEIDLHRPYIDEVKLVSDNGTELSRVLEVMDVWFDSGAMPFAQDHYPFENKEKIENGGYPADFISEAIDQTRGWFYTLHAVGALMGKGKAYKNVICLGLILDAEGKKMSKSLGNGVNPWEMMDKYGADVLRFWMYSVNQPGDSKNFDEKTVDEVNKKVFNLLKNVVNFYEMFKTGVEPLSDFSNLPVLDRWIIAKLNELKNEITKSIDDYDLFSATRYLREFVGDLSQWYIRRSRDRFKAGGDDALKAEATTRFVLLEISKLMAPFAPFFAEDMYQRLKTDNDPESIHLCDWPKMDNVNQELLENMELSRKIVSEVLMIRNQKNIKVRQPLNKLIIQDDRLKNEIELLELIKDEVNIKEINFNRNISDGFELDLVVTPELKEEGIARELMRAVQDLRKDKGLMPADRIVLAVATDEVGQGIIKQFEASIKKTVGAETINFVQAGAGEILEIEGIKFVISF